MTSQGNTGIATSTPVAALSLGAGNTYLNSNLITLASSSASTLTVSYQASATSTIVESVNSFSIGTTTAVGNSPIFSIDGLNGRVGIGTSSPVAPLVIDRDLANGSTYLQINDAGVEKIAFITNSSSGRPELRIGTTITDGEISVNRIDGKQISGDPLVFGLTFSNQNYNFLRDTGAIAMQLSAAGNMTVTGTGISSFAGSLGIGTTTPGWINQISGVVPALVLSDTNLAGDNNAKHWFLQNNGGSFSIGTTSNLLNATSTYLTILNGGFVGIGSSSPSATTSLSLGGGLRLQLLSSASGEAVCHDGGTDEATDAANGSLLVDCGAALSADYMEFYPVESDLEPGDLVMPSETVVTTNIGKSSRLTKTKSANEKIILGVVSDPAFATDFNAIGSGDIPEGERGLPIALKGRVPVKVSTENGPIKIGDRITSSSLAGVGMKATDDSGMVVGFAIDNFDGTTATSTASVNGQEVKLGRVTVFINLGYANLDENLSELATADPTNAFSIDQQSGKVNVGFFGTIDMNGNDIINVGKILSDGGKWKIEADGTLTAEKVVTKDLEVKNGILLYDEETGGPYCVRIKNGALVSAAGICGASSEPVTDDQLPVASEPEPEPIVEPEPAPESQTTEAPASEPITEPAPEPEPPLEEPTLEPEPEPEEPAAEEPPAEEVLPS